MSKYTLNQRLNQLQSKVSRKQRTESQHSLVVHSLNSANASDDIQALADVDFQKQFSLKQVNQISAKSIRSSGFIGTTVPLESSFESAYMKDGEGSGYQYRQRYSPYFPLYPETWGFTFHQIYINKTVDTALAFKLNSLTCETLMNATRIEKDRFVVSSDRDVQVARLHSKKFKSNSTAVVKISGCRVYKNHINKERGMTQFRVKVWGIDEDDNEICNEIHGSLANEIEDDSTVYSSELYSQAKFAKTGCAWNYDQGMF